MEGNLKGKSRVTNVTKLPVLSILVLVGILYILTMPVEFGIADAAVEMGEAIKDGFVRSRHLLTTLLYSSLLNINAWFGFFSNIIILPQLFNIITGLASAYILYATQIFMGISVRIASYLTLIYLISNRVWLHSITTVPDIHPQFFLTVSIYFLIKFLIASKPDLRQALYSFIGLCIAALFCLNFVLFIPGFLIGVYIKLADFDKHKLMQLVFGLFTVFLIVIIVPFYIAAIHEDINSLSSFIYWLKYHPDATRLSHLHTFGAELILRPFSGIIALFVEPGSAINVLKSKVHGIEISENVFMALPLLFFSVCLVTTLVLLALLGLTKITNRALLAWLLVSFVLFTLFNLWWLGSDPKFWLPLFPLFILLTGMGIMSLGERFTRNKYLKIACLITPFIMIYYNLPKEIPSILFPDGGSEMQLAREFNSRANKPGILFTPGMGWPDFVEKIGNKINIINLVYSDKLGDGPDYFPSLDKQIAEALREGKQVYFDNLVPPLRARQNGSWLMIKSGRGVSREQLLAYLQQRYKLDSSIMGLVVITGSTTDSSAAQK